MTLHHPIQSDALDDMEIVCVLDGYEPRYAHYIVGAIAMLSDEEAALTITLAIHNAYGEAEWN